MLKKILEKLKKFFDRLAPKTPPVPEIEDSPVVKPPPDLYTGSHKYYYDLYSTCEIAGSITHKNRASWALDKALKGKARYQIVELATGAPWYLVAALHSNEASFNWTTCLHNGQPFNRVTTIEPRGLGPWNSWEEAAIDAIDTQIHKQYKENYPVWTLEECLKFAERYNGLGYLKYHPETKSPYVWSCTNLYTRGKYVRDGKFDPEAPDEGVGVAALFKILERGNHIHLQYSEKGLLAQVKA